MANKLQWAQRAQGIATTLAQQYKEARDLLTVFNDRGFDTGGKNPVTNEDLLMLGLSFTELKEFVVFLGDFKNFMENGAVSAAQRATILNQLRNDI